MNPSHGIHRATCIMLAWALQGIISMSCVTAADVQEQVKAFLKEHEETIRPLEIAANRAWWDANVSGKDEDFAAKEQAQNKLDAALADPARFAKLKSLRDAKPQDKTLARVLDVLYLVYLEKQVPPELLQRISSKANSIEKKFNVFRAPVGDEQLTDSEVRKVLTKSKDPAQRQKVWEASKQVGADVETELKELVLLRNEAARKLGFPNYHAMQLHVTEHRPEVVLEIFDKLDKLTRDPFAKAKAEIDQALAKGYGIKVEDLRPWHYHDPFFQQPPDIGATSLDAPFVKANIEAICSKFYTGIGLPIDDVLARSDLYEKPGKSPHAFCTDIDRQGDVRVLANIVPNEYWMATMLHELGHAVYSSKNIPASVPYAVRTESHILATEGVAMMFERFAGSSAWLQSMGLKVEDPAAYDRAARTARRYKLLIFSRWCQVMLRFEQGMYANPEQDLNKLWWDLVENYQMLHRPEGRNAPDYASKIHIVSAPCYYHNYMLGELFACQLHQALAREVLRADDPIAAIYHDDPRVGKFMQEKVFGPGRLLSWNELTRYATGSPLTPDSFAREFATK
ncbi:MAG: hypothetical protein RIS70_1386 [Planctomycetota bacterium]